MLASRYIYERILKPLIAQICVLCNYDLEAKSVVGAEVVKHFEQLFDSFEVCTMACGKCGDSCSEKASISLAAPSQGS